MLLLMLFLLATAEFVGWLQCRSDALLRNQEHKKKLVDYHIGYYGLHLKYSFIFIGPEPNESALAVRCATVLVVM